MVWNRWLVSEKKSGLYAREIWRSQVMGRGADQKQEMGEKGGNSVKIAYLGVLECFVLFSLRFPVLSGVIGR